MKAKEKEVVARDRIITELRLRLPVSKERDDAIVKATAAATYKGVDLIEESPEERKALRVAQSTVASLQVSCFYMRSMKFCRYFLNETLIYFIPRVKWLNSKNELN